jgi:hypothetical protein
MRTQTPSVQSVDLSNASVSTTDMIVISLVATVGLIAFAVCMVSVLATTKTNEQCNHGSKSDTSR